MNKMKNGEYLLVNAPKNYPYKKYRGKYCYDHRLNYWLKHGDFPQDSIIHHIDGNKHNNNISNLELMTKEEHSSIHNREKGITYVLLKCPGCKKQFTIEKRQSFLVKKTNATCCSRKCIGKYTALNKEDKEIAIKENLIKEFVEY